jgi:methionyl aminopeptidase
MRIYLKTQSQIERIRKAGRIAARVLRTCAEMIEPNRTLDAELDQLAEQMVLEMGGFPAFEHTVVVTENGVDILTIE